MRIMIFGDAASGKSTFSVKLGRKLGLPVLHLDEVMQKLGRENKAAVAEYIRQEADKPDWIIEGNAFTKDKRYRIGRAELVIVFASNRLVTLARHVRRYFRVRSGREQAVGGVGNELKLGYYIPYTLWHFPRRRRTAVEAARAQGKQIIVVRSRRGAQKLLETDISFYL